jgi:hypothetical protein
LFFDNGYTGESTGLTIAKIFAAFVLINSMKLVIFMAGVGFSHYY